MASRVLVHGLESIIIGMQKRRKIRRRLQQVYYNCDISIFLPISRSSTTRSLATTPPRTQNGRCSQHYCSLVDKQSVPATTGTCCTCTCVHGTMCNIDRSRTSVSSPTYLHSVVAAIFPPADERHELHRESSSSFAEPPQEGETPSEWLREKGAPR